MLDCDPINDCTCAENIQLQVKQGCVLNQANEVIVVVRNDTETLGPQSWTKDVPSSLTHNFIEED